MIITESIIYRGKSVKVSDLKQHSSKKIVVECPVCHNQREAYYFSVKNNQICHSCSNSKGRKDLPIGCKYNKLTIIRSFKVGKSYCVCDCGTETIVDNYAIVRGLTKSCGCIQKEHASKLGKKITSKWIGKNHPKWKGGISSERQLFNGSKNGKEWKTSVYKRDKYICQKCGKLGRNLNAHHIELFSKHSELRLEINNGITFCLSCHKEFHHIYGNKNIGRKELKEYLSK